MKRPQTNRSISVKSCPNWRYVVTILAATGLAGAASAETPLISADDAIPDVFRDFWCVQTLQTCEAAPARRGLMLRPLASLSDAELAARMTDACYDRKKPPPQHVIDQIERMTHAALNEYRSRYNVYTSWHGTTGTPHHLTYSFVPDGLHIPANPNSMGDPAGTSNLHAKLDADFLGNRAAWMNLFASAFNRWGALTGLSYTLVSDDGAAWNTDGVPGLRGDLRIGGRRIDGDGGVLAWNNFPSWNGQGDMCLDTHEISFFNPFSDPPARKFYNIIAHEHGHGMGLAHVCPVTNSKLMEPFATEDFFGPQHDDIRGAQRMYGDAYENNESTDSAAYVGSLAIGQSIVPSNPQAVGVTSYVPANVTATSIDGSDDVDYFRVNISGGIAINVIAYPVGYTYDSSSQFGSSCGSGNNIDTVNLMQLRVEVYQSSIVNGQYALIGSRSAAAIGGSITLTGVPANLPNVVVGVSRIGGSTDQNQMYHLAISAGTLPPPGNDLCTSPIAIEPGIVIRGSNSGATTTPGPTCAPFSDRDVWFSLVPRGSGTIQMVTCQSDFFAALSAYTGNCNALTQIACSTNSQLCSFQGDITFPVTTGSVYRVRLASGSSFDGAYNLFNGYLPPANDLCANALPAPVNSFNFFSNCGARTDGTASCVTNTTNDVWFRHTTGANDELVTVTACSSFFDPVVSLFTGACGSLTELGCDDDSGQSGGACPLSGASRLSVRVPANQTCYIRVASMSGPTSDFGLEMTTRVYNDLCADAPVVVPGGVYTGSTAGTARDGSASCGGTNHGPDVWFKYTPVCDHTLSLETCGSSFDTVLSVHSGACGSLAQIACNDDACSFQSRMNVPMTGGQTYYIRVSGYNGASGPYRLTVGPSPAPANNVCSGAIAVSTGLTTFTTACAGPNGTASCGSSNNSPAIWYTYTSPCSGTVVANTCGSSFDTVLSVYSGACGSPTEIACNDDAPCASIRDSRVQFNAAQGATYYVRVSGYNNARGPGNLRFTCGCVADVDDGSGTGTRDGGVTIDDLLYYLQLFDSGAVAADVDDGSGSGLQDGGVTIDDLLYYLGRFDAGC